MYKIESKHQSFINFMMDFISVLVTNTTAVNTSIHSGEQSESRTATEKKNVKNEALCKRINWK